MLQIAVAAIWRSKIRFCIRMKYYLYFLYGIILLKRILTLETFLLSFLIHTNAISCIAKLQKKNEKCI